ncbi:N-6 DNA methylase [Cupriavidus necator]|nr:N-6 DNA methylase [Cupriavidus necator]
MLTLGELQAGDTLYTPWDTGAQLSVRGTLKGAAVYLETPLPWRVTLQIGLLADGSLTVQIGDPIRFPQAIEEGKPRQFDVAIAFPPLNQRYEREVAEQDWFGRFPEKTTSGTILSIRHLLAQTRRRVAVAVTPSFLFGRGEAALRIDLLQRGMVQAVVALPSGILSGPQVAIALLVLDPRGGHRTVRFVNADNERFVESLSKARSRLTNTSMLGDLILTDAADPDVIVVSVEEILANDAQLQVSRYVVPPHSGGCGKNSPTPKWSG